MVETINASAMYALSGHTLTLGVGSGSLWRLRLLRLRPGAHDAVIFLSINVPVMHVSIQAVFSFLRVGADDGLRPRLETASRGVGHRSWLRPTTLQSCCFDSGRVSFYASDWTAYGVFDSSDGV